VTYAQAIGIAVELYAHGEDSALDWALDLVTMARGREQRPVHKGDLPGRILLAHAYGW
jgi:hypothetical protein